MKTLKITFVMLMTALFLVLPSCSKDDVNVTLTPSEEVVNAFQQKYPDVKMSNGKYWSVLMKLNLYIVERIQKTGSILYSIK